MLSFSDLQLSESGMIVQAMGFEGIVCSNVTTRRIRLFPTNGKRVSLRLVSDREVQSKLETPFLN